LVGNVVVDRVGTVQPQEAVISPIFKRAVLVFLNLNSHWPFSLIPSSPKLWTFFSKEILGGGFSITDFGC